MIKHRGEQEVPEMGEKDFYKYEKILKYNLSSTSSEACKNREKANSYADQPDGIVKILREPGDGSGEAFRTMQEHHNANHALYYFNLLTDGLLRGRSTGNDCRKLIRAREHMMHLREFIEEKQELKRVIDALLKKLEEFSPVSKRELAQFLAENWLLIQSFSRVYVAKEQCCLTDEQSLKLNELLSGFCYLRFWWWKVRSRRVWLRFLKLMKRIHSHA